jgi:predicted glycoside hydrolase/deacetylase ChbG (UPF0249 family)
MRAQVDRALAFGMEPTHIDTHMGGALCPTLVEAYCRVGRDYRLPVLLPRRGDYYARVLKAEAAASALWREAAGRLVDEGMPLVDDFRMTPGVPTEESDDAYRTLADTLPEGMTFVAIHPNAPGDIEAIIPPRAHFRTDEYRIFGNGSMAGWLEAAKVQTIGMKPFLDLYRAALAAA